MLKAARDAVAATAAETGRTRPLLIGVTALTSLDHAVLREVGVELDPGRYVLRLAALARDCGLDGIVCSAIEAPAMRSAFGAGFALVTPGIRLAGATRDDQARILTPEAAAQAGADYLVIGRPITGADDPVATLATINRALGHPA
jgi:orotidine-5'-phosphate decarboxylase